MVLTFALPERGTTAFYKLSLTQCEQLNLNLAGSTNGQDPDRRMVRALCAAILCATRKMNDSILQALTNPMRTTQSELGRLDEYER